MLNFKKYYNLAKPGIIYGNLISAVAGLILASKYHFDIKVFLFTILGIAFVIGSACVFNNIIDKDIDRKMARTMKRAIVTGDVDIKHALIYGIILGIVGFLLLSLFTNFLTTILGLIGIVDYVVFYGISKRTTIYSTLIGGFSGAMPIIAGYTALTNRIDTAAIILFLILFFWQMPHFYAISIYRLNDYNNAGLVLWSIKKGVKSTKIHMIFYTLLFSISVIALWYFKYVGLIYLGLMGAFCIYWTYFALKGLNISDETKWAKKMFFLSLISLLLVCFSISINSLLKF